MAKKTALRTLKAKAWKLFSEFVRRKHADAGGTEYCYTCGVPAHWTLLQAGHAIGGRHNAVLFDEEIVKPQCVRCNVFMRGQYHIFTTKLIKERGMSWWEGKIEGSREVVKLTRADFEALIAAYKEKLKGLDEEV